MRLYLTILIVFLFPSLAQATGTALGYPSGYALSVCVPNDTGKGCTGVAGSQLWVESPGNVGINTTQNVGIGSANPGQTLDVNGTVRAYQFIAGSGGITLGGVTNTSWPGGSNYWINNSGNVGINTTYNVGIGTNAQSATLEVMGNIGIGTTNGDAYLKNSPPIGGEIMYGNLGIGTWTPNFQLHINSPTPAFTAGTGGTITTYSSGGATYKVHTFTSNGTFTAPSPATNIHLLVVAGGGGGAGGDNASVGGGGGGGGGVLDQASRGLSAAGSYSITIGTAGSGSANNNTNGGAGGNSVFDTSTANGGGGGAAFSASNPAAGGSGGGGSGDTSPGTGNQGTSGGAAGFGNNGGTGLSTGASKNPGGGGGSGNAVGGNASSTLGGNGADGYVSIISGVSVNYGAGGGGGTGSGGTASAGNGGAGGGGNGGKAGAGSVATACGSGGGGGGAGGGNGFAGCVIVSYIVPSLSQSIYTNGTVGINNSSAASLLSITGAGATSATGSINVQNSSTVSTFTLTDDGTVYLKGNVGIGTVTPMGALTVMNGNVGIGTWSPTNILQVVDNGTSSGNPILISVNSTGQHTVEVQNSGTYAIGFGLNNNNGIIGSTNATTVNLATNGLNEITLNTNGNVGIGTFLGVYVANNGNVGIGTTTPAGALTVMNGNVGIGTWVPVASLDVSGTLQHFYVAPSGNVGIGTANPGALLELKGGGLIIPNGWSLAARDGSGNLQNVFFPWYGDNITYMSYATSGMNLRNNAGTSTMFLTNSNNVGIGSANPGQTLDVTGNVRSTTGFTSGTNCFYYCNGGVDLGVLSRGSSCLCPGGSCVATNICSS